MKEMVEGLRQGVLPEYETLLQAHLALLQEHSDLQARYIELCQSAASANNCRRFQAFENGKPVMEIYAHPNTGNEELANLLEGAIADIWDSAVSTDSGKVVNLDAYRKRN